MSADISTIPLIQHPKPNPAWLSQRPEEDVLDPELPIVDPHHHFYQLPDYVYLLNDFISDLKSGHNVVGDDLSAGVLGLPPQRARTHEAVG